MFARLNNLVPSVILCRSCFLGCREVLFPSGLSNQCASFFEALCPKPAGCVRAMLSRKGGAGTGRLLVTRSSACPSLWGIINSSRKVSYQLALREGETALAQGLVPLGFPHAQASCWSSSRVCSLGWVSWQGYCVPEVSISRSLLL